MRKIHLYSTVLIVIVLAFSCNPKTGGELSNNQCIIKIKNNNNFKVGSAAVNIGVNELSAKTSGLNSDSLVILSGKEYLPYQIIKDENNTESVLLILEMLAGEEKELLLRKKYSSDTIKDFPKRTQAEVSVKVGGKWEGQKYIGGTHFKNVEILKVPKQHTDNSMYIRYEGPGWESDLVGYRFYLDWRNATDIFGKTVSEVVLQKVGQNDFESYHEKLEWGQDILKVGNSLGIGSIACWDGEKAKRVATTDSVICVIAENGILQSKIITNYYGWTDPGSKVDLTYELTINAGSRLTKTVLKSSEKLDNFCTGIVKHEPAEFIYSDDTTKTWSYIASFGKQSLAGDNLGMVVFYETKDLLELNEDEFSKVVVLSGSDNDVEYYFGAVWEQDKDKIKTKEEFIKYLKQTQDQLGNKIEVTF